MNRIASTALSVEESARQPVAIARTANNVVHVCLLMVAACGFLSGCTSAASGSTVEGTTTESATWLAPNDFMKTWNSQASSRLDQLRLLSSDAEGSTMISANNSYFIGYEKKSNGFMYIAQVNDQVEDIAARCAAMVHILDPKLSIGEALQLVGQAGQSAHPINTVTMDNIKFSIVRHDPIANCFVYPNG